MLQLQQKFWQNTQEFTLKSMDSLNGQAQEHLAFCQQVAEKFPLGSPQAFKEVQKLVLDKTAQNGRFLYQQFGELLSFLGQAVDNCHAAQACCPETDRQDRKQK